MLCLWCIDWTPARYVYDKWNQYLPLPSQLQLILIYRPRPDPWYKSEYGGRNRCRLVFSCSNNIASRKWNGTRRIYNVVSILGMLQSLLADRRRLIFCPVCYVSPNSARDTSIIYLSARFSLWHFHGWLETSIRSQWKKRTWLLQQLV